MKRFKIALETNQMLVDKRTEYYSQKAKGLSYKRSLEGFFDLFKTKDKKSETIEEFKKHLETSDKISIQLQTNSIENEIEYLKCCKNFLMPILEKELNRINACFSFINNKGSKIVDHLDELVNISYPNDYPHFNKDTKKISNDLVTIIFYFVANDKEKQKHIEEDHINYKELFPNASDEEIQKYRILYGIYNLIPYLSFTKWTNGKTRDQKTTKVSLDDNRVKELLKLNFEFIKELEPLTKRIIDTFDLGLKAERKMLPKEYGDGDEAGLGALIYNGCDFLHEFRMFTKSFLEDYKLH